MLAGTDVLKVNPRPSDLVFPDAGPFPAVADDRPGHILGRQINGQDAVRSHGPQLSPDHLLFAGNLMDLDHARPVHQQPQDFRHGNEHDQELSSFRRVFLSLRPVFNPDSTLFDQGI
jgi:hypothetical protein